jgi:hypothetical protein
MLEFIQIETSELKKGMKYKIIEENLRYVRIFVGMYNGSFYDYNPYSRKQYLWWYNLYYIISPKNNRDVPFTNPMYYGNMEMIIAPMSIYNRKMYKLVLSKEIIQRAMELRAINKILQNIIGDTSFTY